AKAVAIRLTQADDPHKLGPRAIYNLSQNYLDTGAINFDDSEMLREAMSGKPVYIRDMSTDPRVIFPGDAKAEGLASMFCLGIMHQGKAIGTIHLFSGEQRSFSPFEVRLVTAIAQMLGTAIQNARLDTQRTKSRRVLRPLHLAANVQRRILPAALPRLPPYDLAARYVPSFELGGDFYDVIDLDGHIGIAIGDVVGQPMLAHKAVHEGKVAAEVAAGLKSGFEATVIPSVAYTDPEVAWVGLTELEAKESGIAYEKGVFPWAASGRSLSLGRNEGITKLLFDPESKRLLGAGMVGPGAGELIAEAALAIEMGADAEDISLTIHPHPTLSETVAMAAEAFEGTITDLYMPKK
ncbi:MAG: GAF domain-containing protein, partial [Geopsychrobacter sp.]|nr:GAF domain-containing protein [Geopsychrobacter sp.]